MGNIKYTNSYIHASLFCVFFSINSSPINPTYILGGGLIFILFCHIIRYQIIQKYTLLTIIFSFLFLISQLVGIYIYGDYPEGANYLSPFLFVYSVLISACVSESICKIDVSNRIKIYKIFYNVAIIFLVIELLTRLINFNASKDGFYALKFSLLYFDSNFTGLVILSLCSFLYFLKYSMKIDVKLQRRILYILLLATLSRAAIAALIITRLGLSNNKKIKSRSTIILVSGFAIFSFMAVMYIMQGESFVGIDGSFNSKFYIVNKAMTFYQTLPIVVKMFGIGLGNTEQFINIFAHNIYVTMILEMGIVGVLLFVLFIKYTLKISRGYAIYVWLPVFISGISLFSAYSPFIFIMTALICYESNINSLNNGEHYE